MFAAETTWPDVAMTAVVITGLLVFFYFMMRDD